MSLKSSTKKINTNISKGHIIDELCPHTGDLVDNNNTIYSCTLNQTDIDSNKNKFYIMQLIDTGNKYVLYTRWGRIGEPGRTASKTLSNKIDGCKAFERQFKTKTGNAWSQQVIKNFVKIDGKYFLSNVSYDDELKDVKDDPNIVNKLPQSQLDTKVQEFISMISDINMMKNTLVQLDIDTKKMPLGKINQDQINKARDILKNLETNITKLTKVTSLSNNTPNKKNKDDIDIELAKATKGCLEEMKTKLNQDIVKLSSDYYTFIPNACGRYKPPLISDNKILTKYKEILDDLSNIVVAVNIINNVKKDENPIDAVYKDISTAIKPVKNDLPIYIEINKYIQNTHGPTHGCKLQLLDLFEIEQQGKQERFNKCTQNIGNKMLLFHGTPQSCILSILKRDFYLDPTKLADASKIGVQIAGKMFGYGVYFSDCASKSANYCRAYQTKDIGCLLIAEVAMGKICEKTQADSSLTRSSVEKMKCDSVKGVGKWAPKACTDLDGLLIPNHPIVEHKINTSLRYNEFIVYDTDQLIIKYVAIVKNNGDYSGW